MTYYTPKSKRKSRGAYVQNSIDLELIESDRYRITFDIDTWRMSKDITEDALKDLRKKISEVLGLKTLSETFDCSGEEALEIKDFWDKRANRDLCNSCEFKMKECFTCVLMCQSPLERDMLLEFKKQNINPIMQRRINRDGTFYDFPDQLDFSNLLTVPDFYIETEKSKLCIYADGHTYHERTEKQALRDKNIDRELQKLGFIVLRYTGKEIRADCKEVVINVKSHL